MMAESGWGLLLLKKSEFGVLPSPKSEAVEAKPPKTFLGGKVGKTNVVFKKRGGRLYPGSSPG